MCRRFEWGVGRALDVGGRMSLRRRFGALPGVRQPRVGALEWALGWVLVRARSIVGA